MPTDEQEDERHARRVLLGFRLGLYAVLGLIAAAVLVAIPMRREAPERPAPTALVGRTSQGEMVRLLLSKEGRLTTFSLGVRAPCDKGHPMYWRWLQRDGEETRFRVDGPRTRAEGKETAQYRYHSRYRFEATLAADRATGWIESATTAQGLRCVSERVAFDLQR